MKHLNIFALVVSLTLSAAGINAQENDATTQRALAYIETAPTDCALGDGYVCAPVSEMSLTLEQSKLIPAEYLEVWPAVYLDFKAMDELSEAQKQFKHYKIGFAEDEQHFIVMFRALLLPDVSATGETTGLLPTSFGKSLRYLIDKSTMLIVSRQFYR